MKSQVIALALLVLGTIPVFGAQAFIEKPDVQFKTLAEIQAEALEKINDPNTDIDENSARQQRILSLSRNRNIGRNRVKSSKISFKKRPGTTSSRSQSDSSENLRFARKKLQKKSVRDAIREKIRQRKNASQSNTDTANPERRSSFEFVPEPGQIWGR